MNIQEKLLYIQAKVKAPKNLYNSFGKYSYRNAEGILEAVKPFLDEMKCTLTISDEIVAIGNRIYVKANATLWDTEKLDVIAVSAYAREAETKKGMDDSQVTGTASSYARKYALNGLFLLDDTKDPDTDEYAVQTENTRKGAESEKSENTPRNTPRKGTENVTVYASEPALKTIKIMVDKAGLTLDKVLKKPLEELTADEAAKMIIALKKKLGE